MSYRFYPERVEPLGQKAGIADTDLLVPIQGINGLRITIPTLRISCGATAQVVSCLQVAKSFTVTISDDVGKTVTLDGLAEDLTDALVAVDGGDDSWFFSSVTGTVGEVVTLADAFPTDGLKAEGRFFVFTEEDDESTQSAALTADSENLLETPAPGVFQGADLNYPVMLHVTNDTNAATLRGGVVVYINR